MGECGAFVGYSAVSVAKRIAQVRLLSVEIDPIHVAVARYVASLALPAADINIQVGRACDLLPWLLEDSGAIGMAFVFMDHSNTHFHEDYRTLEQLAAGSSATRILADNVLKPGAPFYLWMTSWSHVKCITWAMCEFQHEDQEDWMVSAGIAGPRQPSTYHRQVSGHAGDNAPLEASLEELFTWRWSWVGRGRWSVT